MSLFGSLAVGISGMQSQSTKLDVISNNISNINTVGYKEGVANFADLISGSSSDIYSVNGSGSPSASYFPSGARAVTTSSNSIQGGISSTTSATDLAIAGSGFFAVSQNPSGSDGIVYTRAGSFTQDKDGNLVNTAGFYLQGWRLDASGNLPSALTASVVSSGTGISALQTINVQQLTETAVPTDAVSIVANLKASQSIYAGVPAYNPASNLSDMASGAVNSHFNVQAPIVDSTGASHTFVVGFLKTAINTWSVEIYAQPASDVTAPGGQVAAGTVTFNGDGTLASVSPSLAQPISINWTDSAASSSIPFSWGTAGQAFGTPGATSIGRSDGLSQFDSVFSEDINANGTQISPLNNIAVTSDGYVQATFENGATQNFYKIPLANFLNPDQLQSQSYGIFTATVDTGTPDFLQPGQAGAGKLDPSALEASNVDLGSQLTDMIVAQRAYQFNSKIASTTDTMLQTLDTMGTT